MRLNVTGSFFQQSCIYRGSDALDVVRFNLMPQAAEVSSSRNTAVEDTDVFIEIGFRETVWMLSQDNLLSSFAGFGGAL